MRLNGSATPEKQTSFFIASARLHFERTAMKMYEDDMKMIHALTSLLQRQSSSTAPVSNDNYEKVLEKTILDEISGKNQAIHAYDKILWTVRAGFLTLFFGTWSIVVKSIIESFSETKVNINPLLGVMLLLSVVFSLGGLAVDQNYVRRNFRVIYALDKLLSAVIRHRGRVAANSEELAAFVQVSGDKDNQLYLKVSGYGPERRTGLIIYLLSLFISILATSLLWNVGPDQKLQIVAPETVLSGSETIST
jgi:hypothetical protein